MALVISLEALEKVANPVGSLQKLALVIILNALEKVANTVGSLQLCLT